MKNNKICLLTKMAENFGGVSTQLNNIFIISNSGPICTKLTMSLVNESLKL